MVTHFLRLLNTNKVKKKNVQTSSQMPNDLLSLWVYLQLESISTSYKACHFVIKFLDLYNIFLIIQS